MYFSTNLRHFVSVL